MRIRLGGTRMNHLMDIIGRTTTKEKGASASQSETRSVNSATDLAVGRPVLIVL